MTLSNKVKRNILFFAVCIIAILGALALLIALFWKEFSVAFNILATILSMAISLISIIYTYASGEKSLETMDKIEEQNQTFVSTLHDYLINENFDEENLQNIREEINSE